MREGGREGKGREGKGREGKGREGKGREGKGREGKGREGKGKGGRKEKERERKRKGGQRRSKHIRTFCICCASSLVGANTSAWQLSLEISICSKIEMAKVAVFPVPDCA